MSSDRKLLLTNDDGFDAPGIAALRQAIGDRVMAVRIAPVSHLSGCSHRVSGPEHVIEVVDRGGGEFAIDGTPADCVRLGLHHLTGPVDWVISGINEGGNLGTDVHYSGTVAAVREGVIHGVPGIAVSQYKGAGIPIDWSLAAEWAAEVIGMLTTQPIPPETFWNVNLPHTSARPGYPEVVYCQVDPSPLLLDYRIDGASAQYRGSYHARPRRPGWDVDVCFSGKISVSLVHLMSSVEQFD